MANCLQKIPSENESRAEGENDEMGIPNYRERSRLNYLLELIKEDQKFKKRICHVQVLYFLTNEKNFPKIKSQ